MSLRAWPADFPEDITVQRRVPFESRADSVMYRQVLAELARDRGWDVHLYNANDVEAEAVRILGERADEVLHGPRSTLGPPWSKDHRTALAATIVTTSRAPAAGLRSARRREELEGDAVWVSEADARTVGRVLDAAVSDAQLVKSTCPLLELCSVGASEGDVVEADAELAELLLRRRCGVLVQTEQRVADQVDGVVKVGIGVFVEDGLGSEERFVPRDTDGQVTDGQGDVGQCGEGCHGRIFSRRQTASTVRAW